MQDARAPELPFAVDPMSTGPVSGTRARRAGGGEARSAAPIAVTTGEPAGIGPEISLRAALGCRAPVVLLGDAAVLQSTAQAIGIAWPLPPHVDLAHVPVAAAVHPGRLDVRNAAYVLALIDRAIDGCLDGRYRALVTAPVQKSVIADSGVAFSGHTEYLAQRARAAHVVMLLVGTQGHRAEPAATDSLRVEAATNTPLRVEAATNAPLRVEAATNTPLRVEAATNTPLRVALATTHLPLAAVPRAITADLLRVTLDVIAHDLRERFGLAAPRIGVAGLNPHAGEGGHLGREEIEVIAPAVAAARGRGIDAIGPLPADTLFVPRQLARFDVVLAMYHDQGLPVLKHASFGHGVNVTLGLPFVRTSVDHGTALDLAGSGRADAGSMIAALALAIELAPGPPC